MIKYRNLLFVKIFIIILMITKNQLANEILIYADSITYDKDKNIIARGNVKVINETKLLTSDLIIYKHIEEKFILPVAFQLKDEKNNYYFGQSGFFKKNLKDGEINNVKILMNEGSRIVGKKGIKNGPIDLIHKATYSSCQSKIKIGNFVCPIWQLESETVLHDNEILFLYQKHSKMRFANIPVFYTPYLITPSPLRKTRKSGFLNPSFSLKLWDTKIEQTISTPYYFNLDIDKELTLTPIINYGGGVDSSQRFLFDYNQKISGGAFDLDVTVDTSLAQQNNNKWLKDASLVTSFDKNINEKFHINIESALQTSDAYFRNTDPNNNVSYYSSLATELNLSGYDVYKQNDLLNFNLKNYQEVKSGVDNKVIPTVFPYVSYETPLNIYENITIDQSLEFYNIFRDKSTSDHAQKQRKLATRTNINKEFYKFNSKLNFKSEIHNQYFKTENKQINNIDVSGDYYRFFPIAGIYLETPFVHPVTSTTFSPKIGLIFSPEAMSYNNISNEDSTNNKYAISNQNQLNRFSGTDNVDDSNRIMYSIGINKGKINFSFVQNYEFNPESNYNKQIGNSNYLNDALLSLSYNDNSNKITYTSRYDPNNKDFIKHLLSIENDNRISNIKSTYINERKETNNILEKNNEYIDFNLKTKKFNKYSTLNYNTTYNLITNQHNYYSLGYEYFDECFGINMDFRRSFYTDNSLKPSANLTMMLSFKNLGSYKSTNLAVSETDKQDIQWDNYKIDNNKFLKNN